MTRGDTQVRLAGADASIDEAWAALRRIMAGREVAAAYTLGEALADRLRHQEACFRSGSLAGDRIKYLRRVYREATEALGSVPLADLTPAALLDWLSSRPTWSSTTRNVAGGMVRAAVRAAVRAGKASRDPLDGLRLPRQSRREAIPTDGEILAARDRREDDRDEGRHIGGSCSCWPGRAIRVRRCRRAGGLRRNAAAASAHSTITSGSSRGTDPSARLQAAHRRPRTSSVS